jgi:putative endonuclease
MNQRARREAQGRRGEAWAALYLRLKGWRIVARRLKTPRGEIDLIARRSGTTIFVEVKWRASADLLEQAVDPFRLRRVAAAAEAVTHRFAKQGDLVRIDVLLLAPWRFPRHLENALVA